MRFRCREDTQFGVIFLRSSVHPSPSEHSHVGRALELVKQSGLNSNTLFATFVNEALATGTIEYGFDGSVASFQETTEQAFKMFNIALSKPIKLDLLLKELQTISEGATNRKGKGLKTWQRFGLGQSDSVRKD